MKTTARKRKLQGDGGLMSAKKEPTAEDVLRLVAALSREERRRLLSLPPFNQIHEGHVLVKQLLDFIEQSERFWNMLCDALEETIISRLPKWRNRVRDLRILRLHDGEGRTF